MNFDVTILLPTAFVIWLVTTIFWSLISLHHRKITAQTHDKSCEAKG